MLPARAPRSLRFWQTRSGNLAAYRTRPLQPAGAHPARHQSTAPQRQEPEQSPSAYKQSMQRYNSLRKPWLRVLLGAYLTYQILYWSWEKMRTDEIMAEKTAEVQELEREVEVYKGKGGTADG